jgi:prophage regulatory protein
MPTKLLRLPQVLERVPFCRATIYQLMRKGEFPKQVKMGERSAGWVESEIEAWVVEAIKKSRAEDKTA